MMNRIILLGVLLTGLVPRIMGQEETVVDDSANPAEYERFIQVMEQSLQAYYEDYEEESQSKADSIIRVMGYDEGDVPQFSDSVYCARLDKLNEMSPFQLDCNDDVLRVIDYFALKRRRFTGVTLGRAQLYFNMFEEKLAAHDMPIELKYLSVIESGLRPGIRSRAGALGLWQFMYRTGKMYGLNQNSYIDERMDPEKATDAACKYLKQLYNMYDDWNMALAAYNAGPGNVNKAIRRSGGKMTYWEIRPYLPRETRGYVPNFIAMSYMMNYYAEHNVRPAPPKFRDFDIDTVCLKDGLHMQVIDSLIGWSKEEIKALNPIYKTAYIPKTTPPQCIKIPRSYVGDWIAMEDSIYELDSTIYESIVEEDEEERTSIVHYVRSGQNLGYIAMQHGTSVRNIMDWNNLHSTRLSIGQRLVIYTQEPPEKKAEAKQESADKKADADEEEEEKEESSNSNTDSTAAQKKEYTIKNGDSLWTIARDHDTTVGRLRKLNPNVDHSDLKVGKQLRIE
ncbi:MAG: transglycosylase SLT domain-containing protein [Bacteroidota bacterium]